MAGHTKGPWGYSISILDDGTKFAEINGVDNCICYVSLNQDEIENNVSLMAAAPELLEALRDVLGIIGSVCPEYNEATMCANARAAIAKATKP